MAEIGEFLLSFLSQFAGGPGPPENNLVRFGLAAIMWGVLLITARGRMRKRTRARESLLMLGFGLALVRELLKLGSLSYQIVSGIEHGPACAILVPLEHALTLIAVVFITGAYLRYILDDEMLARRYLTAGLVISVAAILSLALWWGPQLATATNPHFHETWGASAIHLLGALLILPGLGVTIWRRGWTGNVVAVALSLLFVSEVLVYANFATSRVFAFWLCPIGNAIYLLAIPIFGYVYFHEQQNEQLQAEAALRIYREHLEEIVRTRTSEISQVNRQLQEEIRERKYAQLELTRRNTELAAQNAIAATVSQLLALDCILDSALTHLIDLTGMQRGCVFLVTPETERFELRIQHSGSAADMDNHWSPSPLHWDICHAAITQMSPVVSSYHLKTSNSDLGVRGAAASEVVVGVPLVAEDHAVGALTLSGSDEQGFEPQKLRLLTSVGQQIGLAVANAKLQERLASTAALEERQRIAAEMHDGLAQTLSYIGLKTDRALEFIAAGETRQATAISEEIREAIGQASIEVRRSIASLQEAPKPRQSVQDGLGQVLDSLATGNPPAIEMIDNLAGPLFLESAALEQIVRVVQEAVGNAMRHAAAQTIQVYLNSDAQSLQISVIDDGQGFEPGAIGQLPGEHFGLNIMRARAARVGGGLFVRSEPGAGAQITLTVPLPNAPRTLVGSAPEALDETNGSLVSATHQEQLFCCEVSTCF